MNSKRSDATLVRLINIEPFICVIEPIFGDMKQIFLTRCH